MSNANSIFVEQSTWLEVQHALNEGLLCAVPIGASCKEHGPHLPLNTDYIQARWLTEQLAQKYALLVWPVVSAGYYPAFVEYPGSWSIEESTFRQCMLDIIASIAKHGQNRIVLLNTGISTIPPLEKAIVQSPYRARTTLINVYAGLHTQAVVQAVEQQRSGGHADEIETSIMLAIESGSVRTDEIQPGYEDTQSGPLNPTDPTQPNYCPSGAMGNPTLADAEKGYKVLAAMLADISEQIESLVRNE